ncbi:glycosyltransferase family 2 protein [Tenacibaculum haliotis]|uniref:glycosyltransferase family 2 protein n=1 Tax=Tenacibaculum haliotis TaxID=1888914 RepID=UPI0021B004AB|nr:glycosyltransferase family A protein [Tenacibaculum haliotis]MCT4698889.1 glycosyltransferase [Tenacibaculum haliotis]
MISIIVPVYNTEKYLRKCLESIENQTYKNFEVILINDGSKDNSLNICKEFISGKFNYKLLSQENKGLSSARNEGLKIATGEYVTFLDSDDWLESQYLERLYSVLKKYNADISICEFNITYESKSVARHKKARTKYNSGKIKAFSKYEALSNLFMDKNIRSYAWGKLFKIECFKDLKFPLGKKYEDMYTMFKVFEKTDVIVKIDLWLLNYLQHDNNITAKNKKSIDLELDLIGGIHEQTIFINLNKENLINFNKIQILNTKKLFKSKKEMIRLFDMNDDEYKFYESKVNEYLKETLTKIKPLSFGVLLYLPVLLILHKPKIFKKFLKLTGL